MRTRRGWMRTKEGVPAVLEFQNFLKKQKPIHQLKWSDELMLSSKDHVKDCASTGKTGHTGTDGSSPH